MKVPSIYVTILFVFGIVLNSLLAQEQNTQERSIMLIHNDEPFRKKISPDDKIKIEVLDVKPSIYRGQLQLTKDNRFYINGNLFDSDEINTVWLPDNSNKTFSTMLIVVGLATTVFTVASKCPSTTSLEGFLGGIACTGSKRIGLVSGVVLTGVGIVIRPKMHIHDMKSEWSLKIE